MTQILFEHVYFSVSSWNGQDNLLGSLDIRLISCTFVIIVGTEYDVYVFFVHSLVFLGAHVSAVSLLLSPASTFSYISYVELLFFLY